ncbi:ribonuclease domain-containing protein [Thermomonas sp.]
MPNTNKPRIHWALWLLGIVMLLAWQYWPQESASLHAPAAEHTPALVELPAPSPAESPAHSRTNSQLPAFLPAEARTTIALIQRGGPFPHRQDGSVFGNREGHLPRQPRGWYHEYTVDTPGLSHRGARRIITGGNPPQAWYYTSDHYDSFRAFDPGAGSGALR